MLRQSLKYRVPPVLQPAFRERHNKARVVLVFIARWRAFRKRRVGILHFRAGA